MLYRDSTRGYLPLFLTKNPEEDAALQNLISQGSSLPMHLWDQVVDCEVTVKTSETTNKKQLTPLMEKALRSFPPSTCKRAVSRVLEGQETK